MGVCVCVCVYTHTYWYILIIVYYITYFPPIVNGPTSPCILRGLPKNIIPLHPEIKY